ncbi:MAG TPA: carbamoyltransferase C-terminal domain-containing protein, partial [Leptospiraceae bacterium]|nr:carbamoyltransferase C-terminal domain-containing protein [Leptospiraceae bacterium]
MKLTEIPENSVIGINYSGMHDSAVVIVSESGKLLFASSLERVTRIKQDGRKPSLLFSGLNLDKIKKIAVSTNYKLPDEEQKLSKVHPVPMKEASPWYLIHPQEFHTFFESLPAEKVYFCHQLSHAHSAFWLSGFDDALCLTYDGGMANSHYFGGVYSGSRANKQIQILDQFSGTRYAKVTSLYTIVTAMLGFTPNKHEGKITGLAAYGTENSECESALLEMFHDRYKEMEDVVQWIDLYSDEFSPFLHVDPYKRKKLWSPLSGFSKEDLAHSVQKIAEEHILEILKNIKKYGWYQDSICLAGGLFSNVRINQKVKEFGFKNIFICPPMTDDGTALGAALAAVSAEKEFAPEKVRNMFLGYSYSDEEIKSAAGIYQAVGRKLSNPAIELAAKLKDGKVIAVFQGKMEFGPRALGNRSIISSAERAEINHELNLKLNRTEFMPFAPMTLKSSAHECFTDISGSEHSMEFMTITCNCTERMKKESPAVVHIDGTARPQLITEENNPFIYNLLMEYKKISGLSTIINTSFNVHEEPIVCSPEDALLGFLVHPTG